MSRTFRASEGLFCGEQGGRLAAPHLPLSCGGWDGDLAAEGQTWGGNKRVELLYTVRFGVPPAPFAQC